MDEEAVPLNKDELTSISRKLRRAKRRLFLKSVGEEAASPTSTKEILRPSTSQIAKLSNAMAA